MKFYATRSFIRIFTILLLYSSTLNASVSKLDSLHWVLEQEAPNWPSDQLSELMLDIAKAHLEVGEFEKAKDQLERGLGIANSLDQKELGLPFILQLGNVSFAQHDYKSATTYYQEFVQESGKSISPVDRALTFEKMSSIALANGNYD